MPQLNLPPSPNPDTHRWYVVEGIDDANHPITEKIDENASLDEGTVLLEILVGVHNLKWRGYRLHHVLGNGQVKALCNGFWVGDEYIQDAFMESVNLALRGDFTHRAHAPRDPNGRRRDWVTPSQAKRWLKCPVSVRLSDEMAVPSESSDYAEEGTAAHELAEHCLQWGVEAEDFVGIDIGNGYVSDETMCRHVQVYLDAVRGDLAASDTAELLVEARVLADVRIGTVHGSSDAVVIDLENRTLRVYDLKYGKGVLVDADDNEQLLIYGIAALDTFDLWDKVDRVVIGVVQPRRSSGDGEFEGRVRRATYTIQQMGAWRTDVLLPGFAATQQDYASFTPSDAGCRWCPAASVCAAPAELAYAAASEVFAVIEPTPKPAKKKVEAVAKTITAERMGEILRDAALIKKWLDVIEAAAKAALLRGEDVPGYKLVQSFGNRTWNIDVDEVPDRLAEALGVDRALFFAEPKVLTAPQTEKVLKQKGVDKAVIAKLYAELVSRPEGGPKIAPESSTAPAYRDPSNVFETVSE